MFGGADDSSSAVFSDVWVLTDKSQQFGAYKLGGSISGLTGNGLVLAQGGTTLPIPANSTSFSFGAVLVYNSAYNVTVKTQPTGQTCTLSNASGALISSPPSDVSNLTLSCI